MISLSRSLVLLLATLASVTTAAAQNWPARPLTLVVGFPAGGADDAIARIFAPRLAEKLGQPVNVENVAGKSGLTAATRVAKPSPTDTKSSSAVRAFTPPANPSSRIRLTNPMRTLRPSRCWWSNPSSSLPARIFPPPICRIFSSLHVGPGRRCATALPASARPRICPASALTRRPVFRHSTLRSMAAGRRCKLYWREASIFSVRWSRCR